MTLLTAINASGGFNDFADQRHVRLLRGSQVTVYDVRQFRKDPEDISICANCTYAFEGGDYPDVIAETVYLAAVRAPAGA